MTRFLLSATSRIAVILMLVGFASVSFANRPAPSIDTFDVPNATLTYPTGINPAGQITGYYQDTTGQHGFVRDRAGTITTFDVPGSAAMTPSGINPAGQITGSYDGHGFLRQRDGTIITFDAQPENQRNLGTFAIAINPSGQIAGYVKYWNPATTPMLQLGFLRDVDGSITTFPDQGGTLPLWYVAAINPAGAIVGFLNDAGGLFLPFLRNPAGTLTTFSGDLVLAHFTAINPSGQITGYGGRVCLPVHAPCAFVREPDGTITVFTVQDGKPFPVAINPAGQIAGYYEDAAGQQHGFVREPHGPIETFDVMNSTNTHPTSMNTEGDITGWYADASGSVHGFVRGK